MKVEVAIIGAGIAGASLAAEIAPHRSVLLVEGEDRPGFHATGRSAAFWSETYGGPLIRPLTAASRQVLERPDRDFSDRPFLSPRGELHLAAPGREQLLDELAAAFGPDVRLERVGRDDLTRRVPGLRAGWNAALWEPGCADIDVAGLHAAYLRAARRGGATLLCDFRLSAARWDGGWRLRCASLEVEAEVLVNAAGAWADAVAALAGARPLGIAAYRRTMAQVRVEPATPADLPLLMDADGGFYCKGEGPGRVWLSPHDETRCEPGDAAADELDVAVAIERLGAAVDWRVVRVERAWAGLRSFAPDRLPVYGWDRDQPGFFWCAGQGGWGIQTAPAAARMAAGLLLGREVGEVNPSPYLATRF